MNLRRLVRGLAVAGVAALMVAACDTQPRVWNCPQTLPAGPGGQPIPVILTVDDTGRKATPQEISNNNGPELACEADANRNGIGDETEVEVIEQAQNTTDE